METNHHLIKTSTIAIVMNQQYQVLVLGALEQGSIFFGNDNNFNVGFTLQTLSMNDSSNLGRQREVWFFDKSIS